jgi:hypothetical protein
MPGDESSSGDAPAAGLSEFAGAAAKWTRQTGDPKLCAAFLLGWRIGLALDWAAKGEHELWPDDDPGLSEGDVRWAVLTGQIEQAAKDLTGEAGSRALPELGTAPPVKDSTTVDAYRRAVLQRLYVSEQFRGLAFALGAQLEGMCAGTRRVARAQPAEDARRALKADIAEVKKPLLGLATKLPPNAAHSVINSLTLWEEQLDRHEGDFADKLRTQGGVWRSVLSGDVAAKDLLHLSDYIGTAEQVVARLHEFALRALRGQLVVPALLALVLLVAGVLVMVLSDKVAAGATSVVVALGVSWKGIGQYFGRAAAQGEQALWNGQLDWSIAYRATISLRDPTTIGMRDVMFARSRGRRGHYQTWQKWLRAWPDFELDK